MRRYGVISYNVKINKLTNLKIVGKIAFYAAFKETLISINVKK